MTVLKKLRPAFRAESVYGIDWQDAYDHGKRGILFDIDNTLVPHDAPADERSRAFLSALSSKGFRVMVLSNNKEPRTASFAKAAGVPYLFDVHKPSPKGYRKVMTLLGLSEKECIAVGDQLFTDILGANLAGIESVLVDPLAPETDRWWIKLKRVAEIPIKHLHKMQRTIKITKDF